MRPARDRAAIYLLLFFVFCAFTLELYFVIHAGHLPQRHDLAARGFAYYGRGDRAYFDHVTAFERGLESINIFFTQPIHLLLLWGIFRRAAWRYPLQLGVSSYVCYSTTLYLLSNHLTGYAEMPQRDLASLLIFYVPNLPWVIGNAWLAWDAGRAVSAAFRRVDTVAPAI